jgi:magnesium chelatase family protein
VWSLRGVLRDRAPHGARPPFRAPHHSISRSGLIGGGLGLAQPGEISLATRGVLFLDELCEFPRVLLEALRQPLEERTVTVGRARGSVTFPAAFSLVAASNPCPCGYRGDPLRACRCTMRELQAYRTRLSGPVRDRIDLTVSVPRQSYDVLFAEDAVEESSATVRTRVGAARRRETERNATLVRREQRRRRRTAEGSACPAPGATPLPILNADLEGVTLLAACDPTPAATRLLAVAGERLHLSARAFHRVLRVARTIADLSGSDRVEEGALAEALRLRGESSR